jgi:uncharacterized membrane protein
MAQEAGDPTGARTDHTTATTDTGLDENVAAALSYVLGVLTGILFYLLERENEFVRFHAAQSIVVFGAFLVAGAALGILSTVASAGLAGGGFLAFGLLSLFVSLVWFLVAAAGFVLWLYLIVRAYQGATPRIPVAAGIADGLV